MTDLPNNQPPQRRQNQESTLEMPYGYGPYPEPGLAAGMT